jgi:hypothetical protein
MSFELRASSFEFRGAKKQFCYDKVRIMKDFKKLKVWQKGMKTVELTYQLTDDFPNSEQFGLTHQCRKLAAGA